MNGDEREARIRELLPLVKQLARRVHRMIPTADLDDLIGDGSVGLIRAIDAFDPSFGVPPAAYARKVVLGAILNGVRRMDRVPERTRRVLRTADAARFALAQQLGVLPTHHEMEARIPGLAQARASALRATPLSLDASLPPGEHLEPDSAADPQLVYEVRGERARVRAAIGGLSARQRRVIVAYYFQERSLRRLHAEMGISPQRVSQLHLSAMRRLRAVLGESA
ncbi:RNA polymerase sigma factor [Vulcanimicrobium alpinum]|uniref:RNA polymerase sigma factor n=1 Tax=Vulcanimicrobium alpinum TaxID=3016050 RepID=A0AAN1XYH7_UNVUL|nr:sigma-70 family RNA polymerase sigma factor [Vulcanimicrobium alpinum]BDE07713.1 RNA polymerase sigma factor [Vulcanimicrobium alpinum]